MKKRNINYPVYQYYDGNKPSPGHLFPAYSQKALCGRKKEDMSHPVLENEFDKEAVGKMSWVTFSNTKTCIKCSSIVLANERIVNIKNENRTNNLRDNTRYLQRRG